MYTFSSKLKTFSFILMLLGVLGIGIGFMSAPKTIQDVETILKTEEAHHEGGHEAVSAHEEAKSPAQAKAKAEHEEHVEHVFHQLQNKPWAALYVACIFFLFSFGFSC